MPRKNLRIPGPYPDATLISLQQGSVLIGVDVKTLRRWIDADLLTGFRLGPKMLRVDRDELLAMARPLPSTRTVA